MTIPSCPPPAYAPNLPLTQLSTPELLLLATLRLFAASLRNPEVLQPDWRSGLRAAGIDRRGVPAFDRLLCIVVATVKRTLDVRCPRCPRLGEDEGRFLQLVGLLQHGGGISASAILAGWLPSAAVRAAMTPARILAASFAEGGLIVARRHAEAAVLPQGAAMRGDRGLALVQ